MAQDDLNANAEFIRLADSFIEVPSGKNVNNYANVDLICAGLRVKSVDITWQVALRRSSRWMRCGPGGGGGPRPWGESFGARSYVVVPGAGPTGGFGGAGGGV